MASAMTVWLETCAVCGLSLDAANEAVFWSKAFGHPVQHYCEGCYGLELRPHEVYRYGEAVSLESDVQVSQLSLFAAEGTDDG